MKDVFEIIKSIQKIDRKKLPHTEKNLLVSIAIHLGSNDHIWPSNQQMAERIGEGRDYIKVLLMRLKNKGFIKIKGRGKKRDIQLIEDKIFGNSQLPNSEIGNSQLPVGNSQLPPYTKEKQKKNTKEKSATAPDSIINIHPKLDSVIEKIPYKKVKKSSINECLINQGEPYIDYLLRVSAKADKPEWYFRGGVLGYYADFLKSPEYAIAELKEKFTHDSTHNHRPRSIRTMATFGHLR